jgi:tetratricopeptide (TPR) repeat protein
MSKEDAAKAAAVRKAFDDGVTLIKAGSFDEAIAKFNEASTLVPNCADCFYNIGYAHAQKKEWDLAEAALFVGEIKPGVVVPMHYQVKGKVLEPAALRAWQIPAKLVVLEPGTTSVV